MIKNVFGSIVLFLLASSLVMAAATYKDGQVLVRFADVGGKPATHTIKLAVLNSVLPGSTILKDYTIVPGLTLVKLPPGALVPVSVSVLKQSSSVKYAEPDYQRSRFLTPDDRLFAQQWGMNNTGQNGGTVGADISAFDAWDIGIGSNSVIVAVTDTGIDYTHPDLAANMWVNTAELNGQTGVDDDGNGYVDDIYGYDVADSDGNPLDNNFHGTHVAGTIGAVGNNSRGVAGVCWNIKLMAVKIFPNAFAGTYDNWEIAGIEYAVKNHADVMNASWGGTDFSQSLKDAIDAAGAAGILFVAAAGNDSVDNDSIPHYPASYTSDNIIAVMSTDRNDAVSSFSCFGRISVDLAAPGSEIISTFPTYRTQDMNDAGFSTDYETISGTSMAAPHVTGACALIKSINPDLTAAEIKDILLSNVDVKSSLQNKCVTGGRLNVFAAATEAAIDEEPPTPNPMSWVMTPTATGLHTIAMEAAVATDRSGVAYDFDCVTDSNFSSYGYSSNLYIRTGFASGRTYTFRVRAHDLSPAQNATEYSDANSTTTASGTDTLPPAPNPTRWEAMPRVTRPTTPPQIFMTAKAASDESSPVGYYFECVDPPNGVNSGWKPTNSYTIVNNSNFVDGTTYSFRCRTRDALGNESQWSALAPLTPGATGKSTLNVPEPYSTIQAALDAASPGDIIEVKPGTYSSAGPPANLLLNPPQSGLDFRGKKNITLRSSDPNNPVTVAATIIDCGTAGRAFYFHGHEEANDVVAGFTIINGLVSLAGVDAGLPGTPGGNGVPSYGGAIYCVGSSPTIRSCVINNCIAQGGDGGDGFSDLSGSSGGNGANGYGGAIYADPTSNPMIINSTITNCIAEGGVGGNGGNGTEGQGVGGNAGSTGIGYGGGIYAAAGSKILIKDCEISSCSALAMPPGHGGVPGGLDGASNSGYGGGIYLVGNNVGGQPTIIDGTSIVLNSAAPFDVNSTNNDDGGGVYCGKNAIVNFTECIINANSTTHDGGGVYADANGTASHLTFEGCTISANTASSGRGGGLYSQSLKDATVGSTVFDFNDSLITANQAMFGGGLFVNNVAADTSSNNNVGLNIHDCNFLSNTAGDGAGVWAYDCNTTISDTFFVSNRATSGGNGRGGGMTYYNGTLTAKSTVFSKNQTDGSGGAMFFEGLMPDPYVFTNCLITDNDAAVDGGGISCNIGAWVQLTNATMAGNSASGPSGIGGAISCAEEFAYCQILDSILWNNTGRYGSQIAVGRIRGSVFDPTASVEVSYSDVKGGLNDVFMEPGGYAVVWWFDGNLTEDPLFAQPSTAPTYYLSQKLAGQLKDSNCVNAGSRGASDLIAEIGYNATTRTDNGIDTGIVDMGYHYNIGAAVPKFNLTFRETTDGYGTGPGGTYGVLTVDPNLIPRLYNQGTVVKLHAAPLTRPDGEVFRVKRWTGADLDTNSPDNIVTMNGAKLVTVEFESVRPSLITSVTTNNGTIAPSGKTYYNMGTVVRLVANPSVDLSLTPRWTGTDNDYSISLENKVTMTASKTVQVAFSNPRLLHVPNDYTNIQRAIDAAGSGDTIVIGPGSYDITPSSEDNAGLRIDGKNIIISSTNPDDPSVVAGTILTGGWLEFSNVDRNCVVEGITIQNSNWYSDSGPDGMTPGNPSIDGMNGVSTMGGAVRLRNDASPTFRNCVIKDSSRTAGHGGNGACPSGWGGWGGWAHGGGVYVGINGSPLFIKTLFQNCYARGGDGGNGCLTAPGGHGGSWGVEDDPRWDYGPYEPYWKYSGYGGAVYCDVSSTPEFVDCNFVGNRAYGGSCGMSVPPPGTGWPQQHLRIDSFGGAIYCASQSAPKFTGCNFRNNEPNSTATIWHARLTDASSDNIRQVDDYLTYGGAIAYEDDAKPTFDNCTINGNQADTGGAVYGEWADGRFADCNFVNNRGHLGGGMYFVGGRNMVARCVVSQNQATFTDPNLADTPTEGGGIYIFDANTAVTDCTISGNNSTASGGGIFIAGSNTPLLKNCLITGNTAGRDGGGVSVNWNAAPTILNCTIAYNDVTGQGFSAGFGGGVYTSYLSWSNILNSIIWGNTAQNGNQIAIGTGFAADSAYGLPADVNVAYSDVQGGASGVYLDPGVPASKLHWDYISNLTGIAAANPLFVPTGRYYLSQPKTGDPNQKVLSPCVDKGKGDANSLHFYRHTTRTDKQFDVNAIDMGYHYLLYTYIVGDFNYDGKVNLSDLLLFMPYWLDSGCDFPDWCDGRDLNQDGIVNFLDEAIFDLNYGKVAPPSPNPMTWAQPPYYVASPVSARMKATKAINPSGNAVQYYFQRTNQTGAADGMYRDWSTDANCVDTTVVAGQTYGYRVKARNMQPDSNAETGWSTIAYVIISGSTGDINPPTNLTLSASNISNTGFTLTAGAQDATPPITYEFTCTVGGGPNRTFGAANTFNVTGLTSDKPYTYVMRARDGVGNTSGYSAPPLVVRTLADSNVPVDGNAPTPDPMTFAILPHAVSPTRIDMTATTAIDVSGVQYQFEITYNGVISYTGWQASPVFSHTGISSTGLYSYRVRARDLSVNHNMTAWSEAASVDRNAPLPDPVLWLIPDGLPRETGTNGKYDHWHTMTCQEANDISMPVLYKFTNRDEPFLSSGWQQSTTYTVFVGYSHYDRWYVQAMDAFGNVSKNDNTVWVILP